MGQALNQWEEIKSKFAGEQKKRKELHNTLEDLKGKIRVYARIRPISKKELETDGQNVVSVTKADEFRVHTESQNPKDYEFDSVFGPESTQEEVFSEVKRLV